MTETQLSAAIRKALEKAGFWPIRVNSGALRVAGGFVHGAPAGTPDICLVDLGAWLEVKLPGREADEKQAAWHARARKAGVRVAVVSSPVEAVQTALAWRAGGPAANLADLMATSSNGAPCPT